MSRAKSAGDIIEELSKKLTALLKNRLRPPIDFFNDFPVVHEESNLYTFRYRNLKGASANSATRAWA